MKRRGALLAGTAAAVAWFARGGLVASAAGAAGDATSTERALIETFLPFGAANFPGAVTPDTVVARMHDLFHPLDDPRYAATLAIFGDLAAYSAPPYALFEGEAAYLPPGTTASGRIRRDAAEFEQARSLFGLATAFADLPPAGRTQYLNLWSSGRLIVRRRFYRSVKALVMGAAYSLDAMWPAIGYSGPLAQTPRA